MSSFEIRGGRPLKGTITPQGAKNEALQVLCACLLTNEPITFTNVPNILDVNMLIELLGDMNVRVSRPAPNTIVLQADEVNLEYFAGQTFQHKSGKLRGAVMLAGPLLARYDAEGLIPIFVVLKNWVLNLILILKKIVLHLPVTD
jgi:UDP-N-acetylglucosamine 1-carboxyvinyltransferase